MHLLRSLHTVTGGAINGLNPNSGPHIAIRARYMLWYMKGSGPKTGKRQVANAIWAEMRPWLPDLTETAYM